MDGFVITVERDPPLCCPILSKYIVDNTLAIIFIITIQAVNFLYAAEKMKKSLMHVMKVTGMLQALSYIQKKGNQLLDPQNPKTLKLH